MFQYGYTNFQKKGYRFASENEFFHASLKNRNAKLAQLVNHVDTKHTAYLEAEPTAYLGIFTDLDSNQENQRYYFQRSGRILERNAGYAQGYVQDVAKVMKHSSESRFYSCCGYLSGRDRNLCSCQARIVTGISRM